MNQMNNHRRVNRVQRNTTEPGYNAARAGCMTHCRTESLIKQAAATDSSIGANAKCRILNRLSSVFLIAALLHALPAAAAEWKLKFSLNIAQAYSDNIRIAPRGNEQSDHVSQINPGLTLTTTGARLKLKVQYQMQNLFYAKNSQQNAIHHQLYADTRTELVNDLLFLDGQMSVSQQNISALGPQALSNINITGNRADVTTLTLSPYLQHRFQNLASGELRYTHDIAHTNAAGLANNQIDRLALKLDSGEAFNVLRWHLNYHKQQSTYSNSLQAINSETFAGSLSYRITPRFALNAVGGYEKSDYLSIAQQPVGSFFSTGFSWEPSERTSIEASTGRRFFGNNYALKAKHRSRKTTWNISYSEDLTTTQEQFLAGTVTPAQPLPGPVNFLSNRLFLQKSWLTSLTMEGKRNTLMFSLYDAKRAAQTPQIQNLALFGTSTLAQSDRSKQLGGNAFWSSKISPHTTTNLMLGYVKNNFPALGITSHDKNILFGINVQLQTRLNALVEWRHNLRNGGQISADYRENALTASLLMQF